MHSIEFSPSISVRPRPKWSVSGQGRDAICATYLSSANVDNALDLSDNHCFVLGRILQKMRA